MLPEFDYYHRRVFVTFQTSNCKCCDKGARTHPIHGKFCYLNYKKIIDGAPVDKGDELLVELRDGTYVYEYAVKKRFWEDDLKKDEEKKKKLKLYFVMEVIPYKMDKNWKQLAVAALNDFAYENVKCYSICSFLFARMFHYYKPLFLFYLFAKYYRTSPKHNSSHSITTQNDGKINEKHI